MGDTPALVKVSAYAVAEEDDCIKGVSHDATLRRKVEPPKDRDMKRQGDSTPCGPVRYRAARAPAAMALAMLSIFSSDMTISMPKTAARLRISWV